MSRMPLTGDISHLWQVERRLAASVPLMASTAVCGFSSPAEKMRRQNLACSFLQAFIETNEFKPSDPRADDEQHRLGAAFFLNDFSSSPLAASAIETD